MKNLILSEIFIYPVKSLGGISLKTAQVEERGLQYDRRWMLIDQEGVFLTQRDIPEMALIHLAIGDNELKAKFTHENSYPGITIPLQANDNQKVDAIIWNDRCKAILVGKDYDEWFSEALKVKCRLVYMPDMERRIVEKKFISEDKIVSFADAYPFLIIGQSSLDDLNSKLDKPVPMNRFRTNFIFTGGEPYEEDTWKNFEIGNVEFQAVKPCARCVITTTDQQTAERDAEPLRTLSAYRKFGNKVMFGMNLIANNKGLVNVGDIIKLKE